MTISRTPTFGARHVLSPRNSVVNKRDRILPSGPYGLMKYPQPELRLPEAGNTLSHSGLALFLYFLFNPKWTDTKMSVLVLYVSYVLPVASLLSISSSLLCLQANDCSSVQKWA